MHIILIFSLFSTGLDGKWKNLQADIEVYSSHTQQYLSCDKDFDIEDMLSTLHPEVQLQKISNDKITASASNINLLKAHATQAVKIFQSPNQSIEKTEFEDERFVV